MHRVVEQCEVDRLSDAMSCRCISSVFLVWKIE